MTIDKQALRERYSEKPAPKCHICGALMSIQAAGPNGVTYGCTGRIDKDGEGYKFSEGRHFADDHYARSRVTDYSPSGDPEVLALLDELEAKDKQVAELQARDQPKFVQCWSCKRAIEVLAIADCDGYCPRCAAPIDLDDEPYAAGIGVKGE
ncbi:TPA: ead/Ea22-like family protein [Citrobacter farmeri]